MAADHLKAISYQQLYLFIMYILEYRMLTPIFNISS